MESPISPASQDMRMRSVLQIVPSRARYGGIAAYSLRLAESLLDHHGVDSMFLSGTPGDEKVVPGDRWQTIAVAAKTPAALSAALHRADELQPFSLAILHVSGYGYQTRGVPIWLARGLKVDRKRSPDRHFLGVFHELYATGSISNSSFWLSPLQKLVVRQIWSLMDHGMTTNSRYLDILRAWRPLIGNRAWVMPVMSTIGEPGVVPTIASRPCRLVAFGGPGIARLAQTSRDQLRGLIDTYAIDEIADIGERRDPAPTRLLGVPVVCHGRLPDCRVGEILFSSRIGILPYANMQVMGKSTILAAYVAHGVVPYAIDPFNSDGDGLRAGANYLTAAHDRGHDLDAMQRNGRHWYLEHSITKQTAKIAALLASDGDHAR